MHKKPKYKEYKHNPRIITSDQKESLEDTLRRLGDLSGIIFNKKSKEFIGGNQRSKVIDFDNCEIEIVKKFKKPTKQGTTAIGFVLWEGERYNYREVSWDEKTEKEANIVANKGGGEFDFEILSQHFDSDDLIDWGFDESLLNETVPKEPKSNKKKSNDPNIAHTDFQKLAGHNTAINRVRMSTPMNWYQENNLLKGDVLDYGAGMDMHDFERFDPVYDPDYKILHQKYDTVTCNYVINVIPLEHNRFELIRVLQTLLKDSGSAYISIYNKANFDTETTGTFQSGWSLDQWRDFFDKCCGYEYIPNSKFWCFRIGGNN